VTPEARRVEFDAHKFVRRSGTLDSLSKEGKGWGGVLVAGLTVAVTEASGDLAKRSPGSRLVVPLVAVLDEAANLCPASLVLAGPSHPGSCRSNSYPHVGGP
jgi:hypothetical protein